MCLGVPGKVVSIGENELGAPTATVSFGGSKRDVCLAYVPETEVGDYVLVHVGFALSKIDEEEARRVFALLQELGEHLEDEQ